MSLDLEKLKTALKEVLPILDSNVRQAYKEYMDGKIAAGAYSYVHDRHFLAHSVVNGPPLDPEVAYVACAPLAIDIRTGTRDHSDNIKWQEAELQWWNCFKEAGFTAIHKHFNFPVKQISNN